MAKRSAKYETISCNFMNQLFFSLMQLSHVKEYTLHIYVGVICVLKYTYHGNKNKIAIIVF